MTSTPTSSISISAPAKINLGLEILGKRADGFHEIRTLMAMLEFGDHLTLSTAPESTVHGVPGVSQDTNLILRAVDAFRQATEPPIHVCVSAIKRIPMASGLGGASADAAATILALNALVSDPLPDEALRELAASLGSDVPFFLGSPLALGSGTGTELLPRTPVPFDILLIVPNLTIPNKTGTMYGMLDASDCSDGTRIENGVRALAKREFPDRQSLANTFERPLYALAPVLIALRRTLESLDSLGVGLSGAGPAHYVVSRPGRALQTEYEVRALMPPGISIISTHARLSGLHPDLRSQPDRRSG
ncbi:MAG: 4-(cytidine 5'-diphospho)-2-C-methyl-D-erythritol kinase [Chloroflexota bacterium]|nr:4-(cytidine 5'-diphospho)-2-C-methyl-D-erythritol kinase [Chloroflexota bacterium]